MLATILPARSRTVSSLPAVVAGGAAKSPSGQFHSLSLLFFLFSFYVRRIQRMLLSISCESRHKPSAPFCLLYSCNSSSNTYHCASLRCRSLPNGDANPSIRKRHGRNPHHLVWRIAITLRWPAVRLRLEQTSVPVEFLSLRRASLRRFRVHDKR